MLLTTWHATQKTICIPAQPGFAQSLRSASAQLQAVKESGLPNPNIRLYCAMTANAMLGQYHVITLPASIFFLLIYASVKAVCALYHV